MFSLKITQDGQVRQATMHGETLRIGAASDNDLCLSSSFVSHHHAELRVAGKGVEILDAGSLNGVFVAGKRVSSSWQGLPATFHLGADVSIEVTRLEADELALTPDIQPAGPSRKEGPSREESARATTPDGGLSSELAAAVLRVVSQTEGLDEALPGLLEATLAATGMENALALTRPSSENRELLVRQAVGIDASMDMATLDIVLDRLDEGRTEGALEHLSQGRTVQVAFLLKETRSTPLLLVFVGQARLTKDLTPLSRALDIVLRTEAPPAELSRVQAGTAERFHLSAGNDEVRESRSPLLQALHERINAALTSDLPVLLTGETGVGKELYVRAIHAQSTRRDGPLQSVNSSAIPDSLLEALLFGSVEGAATGVSAREGLLQSAHRGTFFLDEIGELGLPLQAKLLRALDRKEVHPIGAPAPIPVDIRLISATNRDLLAEVEAGRFRRDLYFRLTGHRFVIAPLRDRRCDIAPLVDHFLQRECMNAGRRVPGMSVKAMNALLAHHWPGNVRELEMLIRLLVHGSNDGEPLRFEQLPEDMRALCDPAPAASATGQSPGQTLDDRLDLYQRDLIVETLKDCQGNRSTAADQLGISRGRLRRLTQRLDIQEN